MNSRRWPAVFCEIQSVRITSFMRPRSSACPLIVVLVAFAAFPIATHAQTTYQMWNQNFGVPDPPAGLSQLGIRYYGATTGFMDTNLASALGVPFTGTPTSDGRSLLLFDKSEYYRRILNLGYPADAPPPAYGAAELRLPFIGSGVSVTQVNSPRGEDFAWEVVDSGANNTFNVVASGTRSTVAAALGTAPAVDLIPAGTIPTDRIHILRIRALDSDGLHAPQGGKWAAVLDNVGIYDDVPITFDDNSNISGNWTFTGTWETRPDNDNYEGDDSQTEMAEATATINFTGTSVAVLGFGATSGDNSTPDALAPLWGTGTSISGAYKWQIDNGAGGSGIVDQSVDHHWTERWVELLVSGLAPGPHTLQITALGPSTEIPGDYSENGIVDAADYVMWRHNQGQNIILPNENPAATTPGVVDEEDFAYWRSHFGNGVPTRFTPTMGFTFLDAVAVYNPPGAGTGATAVPEPTAWVLVAALALAIGPIRARRSRQR